ncbi:signal transduction histidine kinase [Variovorax sp. 54]|uniref:sensor histidine kinase n=1 Tax=Variovorax sp. 54 TaxID=2035212 RepID=UPI000C19E97B|nr:sensor histidine kinase [Variovorax sp. 54]PIF74013.1 signal transduction histidine kinase [Variovorax sp. 54]
MHPVRVPRWASCWLLGLALWLWAFSASAVEAVKFSALARGNIAVAQAVEVLEDPTARLSASEVLALPTGGANGFVPATPDQLMRGFSTSAVWLRLSLVNDAQETRTARFGLNVTWLRHVEFHLLRTRDGQPAWTHAQAGVSDPMDATHRYDRVPQLKIDLQPGESVQVLVRVMSTGQIKLVLELHTDEAWHHIERNHALLSGLLIGGLLAFAVYSAALWWISRAPMLAFQAGSFALLALYEATYRGYARIALWPNSTDWSYRGHSVMVAATVLCLLLYFHERSRQSPVRVPGRPLLYVLAGVEIVVLLGTLLGPYATFASIGIVNAPLIVLTLTVCTFIYQRRAGPGGRLSLLVMLVICVGALMRMSALMFAERSMSDFDHYALAFPGMLVGAFAITAWSFQETRQRNAAQQTLLAWQAQEQLRLEEEVVRKTRALSEALGQAEQRTREQKELLAYISHDLRAPVATILGNLRLMQDAGDTPAPTRLATIERSAAYQLELIDDLVDYAKGELAPLAVEAQPVQLRTLVDNIAQYADALAQRQHNSFELTIDGALPAMVHLDGKRLQQVVLNLLSNAAKFTRNGTIALRVHALPAAVGDAWQLHFEVTDSGTGIDTDTLDRMTRLLADNAPSMAGGGLGLVIAQRIVQRMGGQLAIHSGMGTGTRVVFSLSTEPAPSSDAPSAPPPPEPIAAPAPRAKPRARGRPLPVLTPLSPTQKDELEALARDGRWSDLHEWVNRLATDAHSQPMVLTLRQALDRLDFEQIRLMARAAPVRAL